LNSNKKKIMVVKICVFMLTILLISGCEKNERYETIEVFGIETLADEQNDEGIFDETGYKLVNAITIIEEGKTYIKTDVKSIEDYYDMEGNYIETEITHSYYSRSKMLLTEDGNTVKAKLQEPSTMLTSPDNAGHFKSIHMTQEEKDKVKKHVLAFMKKL